MANEIETTDPTLTGATLYSTLSGRDDFNVGLRWNGTAFEAILAAHWSTYAVAMVETSAGTGTFQANQPAGIPANSPLFVNVFRQVGEVPTVGDPVVAEGPIGFATVSANVTQWLGTAPGGPPALASTVTTVASGTVVAGSTGSLVVVSGLAAGLSFNGQHLVNLATGESRTIANGVPSGGNYVFSFTGEAGPFSTITAGTVVVPAP